MTRYKTSASLNARRMTHSGPLPSWVESWWNRGGIVLAPPPPSRASQGPSRLLSMRGRSGRRIRDTSPRATARRQSWCIGATSAESGVASSPRVATKKPESALQPQVPFLHSRGQSIEHALEPEEAPTAVSSWKRPQRGRVF